MTLRILYNGACPICSREIALYRRQAERAGADLAFDDLNAADLSVWGISADQARRRSAARAAGRPAAGRGGRVPGALGATAGLALAGPGDRAAGGSGTGRDLL